LRAKHPEATEAVGFYEQPNDWTCGPFALKHALVTLGRLADEDAISQVAATHWWAGTDEIKLARAARHFDCDLPFIRRTDPDRAKTSLVRYINQRLPVIICVDDWGHWVTVAGHEQERFVVIDSKEEPVLKVLTWPQLRNRWCYTEYDDWDREIGLFDLHPVKPRFRVSAKAQISVSRAQFLRRPENWDLAVYWDDYLGDLLEICRPRSARASDVLSMGEFLRRHQELLVSRVTYWHGDLERDKVIRLLRNFRFVAETYGLVIPTSSTRQAVADVAILATMWAIANRGIGDVYGAGTNGE
jgi:hypothetical protein